MNIQHFMKGHVSLQKYIEKNTIQNKLKSKIEKAWRMNLNEALKLPHLKRDFTIYKDISYIASGHF